MRALLRKLADSPWAFPVGMLAPLLLLTALGIHGSSIGAYNTYLHGPEFDDPDLIYGTPKPIRSDEWLVVTPYIVSQAQNGYPRINPDVGHGQDMSIVVNVPYKEWSVLFKPQNLAFFVLPLKNAFAFYWWFPAYLLIVGCYLFVLQLVPKRRVVALLLSFSLILSPFVQWWYTASTLLSLSFSLLVLVVFMRLLNVTGVMSRAGLALLLAYFLACFALIIYPPFQIACAVAAAFFAFGYLTEQATDRGLRQLVGPLGGVAAGILLAGLVAGTFFMTREDIFRTLANTAYPGDRLVLGGDYDVLSLFSTHLMPLVQSSSRTAEYSFVNQSEASNFLYLSPFLMIPCVYLFVRDRRRSDFSLIFVCIGVLLLSLRLLIEGGNWFYRVLLLDKVPGNRLLIGVGLLGFLQLALLYRREASGDWPRSRTLVWVTGIATLVAFLFAGFQVSEEYPGFINSPLLIVALSLVVSSIVIFFASRYFTLGTLVLLSFSVASVFYINPLYRGLDPLLNTSLARELRSIGDRSGAWIVLDELVLEHQPMQQGLRSFSGVYTYPQLDLWRTMDPERDDVEIYNRYAHVTFSTELEEFQLFSPDHFGAPFDGCSSFLQQSRIRYVLSPVRVVDRCLILQKVISYPARDLHIYRVDYLSD